MFTLLVILYVNKLWKLQQKVVYCLSNACRAWYLRVNNEFIELGAKVSKYDKAFYIWTWKCIVQGIVLLHVDDIVWVRSKSFTLMLIMSN